MENKLNELMSKIKSLGYENFVIGNINDSIIIKFESDERMRIPIINTLIREFGVRIEHEGNHITVIY